jgi:hypothetical protein
MASVAYEIWDQGYGSDPRVSFSISDAQRAAEFGYQVFTVDAPEQTVRTDSYAVFDIDREIDLEYPSFVVDGNILAGYYSQMFYAVLRVRDGKWFSLDWLTDRELSAVNELLPDF